MMTLNIRHLIRSRSPIRAAGAQPKGWSDMPGIREYRARNHVSRSIKVGESDGFSREIVIETVDRFRSCGQTLHDRPELYMTLENECRVRFVVKREGVAVVWTPGWGIDVHWSPGTEPDYVQGYDGRDNCPFVDGPCKNDGSSLADGEQAQPAFRQGVDAVWALLEDWWRSHAPGHREDGDAS